MELRWLKGTVLEDLKKYSIKTFFPFFTDDAPWVVSSKFEKLEIVLLGKSGAWRKRIQEINQKQKYRDTVPLNWFDTYQGCNASTVHKDIYFVQCTCQNIEGCEDLSLSFYGKNPIPQSNINTIFFSELNVWLWQANPTRRVLRLDKR